jgi:hypothetical protein
MSVSYINHEEDWKSCGVQAPAPLPNSSEFVHSRFQRHSKLQIQLPSQILPLSDKLKLEYFMLLIRQQYTSNVSHHFLGDKTVDYIPTGYKSSRYDLPPLRLHT